MTPEERARALLSMIAPKAPSSDGSGAATAIDLGTLPEWNLGDLYASPDAPDVTRDLAAGRIGRGARDPGRRQRARVRDALMMREVHGDRRTIGHRRVEVGARGMHAEPRVIVADRAHPLTGRRRGRAVAQRLLDFGHRAGGAAVGPQRVVGADREIREVHRRRCTARGQLAPLDDSDWLLACQWFLDVLGV